MELSRAVETAITGGHLAHLVTLESDGTPQVTLVWVGLEKDEIVAGHLGVWRKVANMRRDPRVVLSMETGGVAANGLSEYLVIHGQAFPVMWCFIGSLIATIVVGMIARSGAKREKRK